MRTSSLPAPVVRRALAALLLATACSGATASGPDDGAPADVLAAADGLAASPGAVTIVENPLDPAQAGRRDPVQITGARVDGDTLRIGVQYGGGCREHTFRLVGGYAWMESLPVQTGLHLGHDAKDDMCRALLRRDLAFSLRPLAEAYRRSYNQRTGTIIVRLEGWTGAELRYTF